MDSKLEFQLVLTLYPITMKHFFNTSDKEKQFLRNLNF